MNSDFSLSGKRILFIGIGFYDYDQAIKAKLEELGGEVSYVCSVSNSIFYRFLSSIGLRGISTRIADRKRKRLIKDSPREHDFVFIIKGEGLTQADIDLVKSQNPSAKQILYFWDDLYRIENRDVLLKNFTDIWSFDPDDCKKYGFKFRPLFYRDNITVKSERKYYMSSIGWCHSNRLELFRMIATELKKENKAYFLKLYTGWKTYFINRYIKRTFHPLDEELLITRPIKFSDTMQIVSDSVCVLDISHSSQKGLSIRTIEALKAGCHVITTNSSILQYRKIPTQCYTILSSVLNMDFKKTPNSYRSSSEFSKYFSLVSFLKELF